MGKRTIYGLYNAAFSLCLTRRRRRRR